MDTTQALDCIYQTTLSINSLLYILDFTLILIVVLFVIYKSLSYFL